MTRLLATVAVNALWQIAVVALTVRALDAPIARLSGRQQFRVVLGAVLCAAALPYTTSVVWLEIFRVFPPIQQIELPDQLVWAMAATWLLCLSTAGIRLLYRWRTERERTAGPATFGLLRPIVVVPPALFKPHAREALAAAVEHEMAHVQRRDWAINLAVAVATMPYALHPGIHGLRRRLAFAREAACDDIAASRMGREPYARGLVAAARLLSARRDPFGVGMLDANSLERRVDRLLAPHVPGTPLALAALVSVLAAVAGAASAVHLCIR